MIYQKKLKKYELKRYSINLVSVAVIQNTSTARHLSSVFDVPPETTWCIEHLLCFNFIFKNFYHQIMVEIKKVI